MFNLIQYADKVASTLRYCIEEIPQAKDRKIFIYFLSFTTFFLSRRKVILYISMIKTYLGKMLLKHENSLDKVLQTFSYKD